MSKPTAWSRAALTGAALLISGSACDSVLGIEEPHDRPIDSGEAGTPGLTTAGKNMGGSASTLQPAGGAGGDPTLTTPGGAGAGAGGQGGEGGELPATECTPAELRCGGDANKTPEVCDETARWVANTDEADGDCALFCAAGKCTECEGEATRCADCYGEGGAGGESGEDSDCNPRQLQTCVDGMWVDDTLCTNYCDAGECKTPTSCTAVNDSRSKCNGASCCQSLLVPGGKFKRDYDPEFYTEHDYPAEVTGFYLDKFEVSVGRMKQFVEAYPNIVLQNGDGKSNHISDDEGWNTSYELPVDKDALIQILKCEGGTWSDTEDTISWAINCVPFNVAYAFCIWDGGRLPSELEWNFAASGGDQQRSYPWGTLEATDEYGHFGTLDHVLPTTVGSSPKGNGRWHHSDLSGNVSEWVLDYFSSSYPSDYCKDCLTATPMANRTLRGGSYKAIAENQVVVIRDGSNQPLPDLGFRCAREMQ